MPVNPFWKRENPTLELLGKIPFFQDLSRRELQQIDVILQRETYTSGEEVFSQGDPGLGMYVVLSGGVEILQDDEDGVRLQLSEVGSGAVFGEMALLDDATRTASAIATEQTELAILYRADLLALAEQRSLLGVKIVMHLSQTVAERLRRTNRSLKEVRDELEAASQIPEADGEEV